MNCLETARLLNPYVDGELDLSAALAIEEHIQACARCRASLEGLQAVRAAVSRECEFKTAPESLRLSLEAGIAGEGARSVVSLLRSPLAAAAPGIAALLLVGWLMLAGAPNSGRPPASGQTRVVYHISASDTAGAALRNLANHLNAAPELKAVVVAHNYGVDFLLRGARDDAGELYETAVRDLSRRGVEFRVCDNTLGRRNIAPGEVIPAATLVPSGIAEIGRLQSREGFIYLRL
jgi:intracellular sulfur oxidation DsrE/DsrF family protein